MQNISITARWCFSIFKYNSFNPEFTMWYPIICMGPSFLWLWRSSRISGIMTFYEKWQISFFYNKWIYQTCTNIWGIPHRTGDVSSFYFTYQNQFWVFHLILIYLWVILIILLTINVVSMTFIYYKQQL